MNRLKAFFVVLAVIGLAGCGDTYVNVPMNHVGMKLTPTGFDKTIHTAGQVNIGKEKENNQGNQLVLLQTSTITIKEAFIGKEGSADKEDHRIVLGNETLMTLDVRIQVTSPDYQKDAEDLAIIFNLGNPKKTEQHRVLAISLEQIYADQLQLMVRNRIRDVCGKYATYSDAFKRKNELNEEIRTAVIKAIETQKVPLRILAVEISNMKVDDMVLAAQMRLQAAASEIEQMKQLVEFLDKNPSARLVYVANALKDIAKIASDNGNNFIVVSGLGGTDLGPLQSAIPALAPKVLNPPNKEKAEAEDK